MIRWISGIALGFLFLTYILLSSSLLFNLGLIIILSISVYELIKLRVLSFQYFLSYFFLGIAILCLYFYELERTLILVAVLISVITDAFAFFTGKAFGRKKIFPKISPNKTYSGVFGAFLMSIIIAYLIDINFRGYFLENQIFINDLYFLFAVFLVSSVSQIGDLIISFFKRSSNIKDTGNLFPGHGGLLDRIDGMIFAFPFVFIISKIL